MTMQVDKARLEGILSVLPESSTSYFPSMMAIGCTAGNLRSIIIELLELRSLRSTEGKEGEIEQLKRERDEAWAARNENAKLKGRRDAALASAKAARENFLTMQGSAAQLLARAEAAEAHVAKLREALTPSGDTKAAYSGEFFERVEIANPMFEDNEDDEPETIMQSVPVSWTTIKEIMAAIEARAALTRSPE